MPVFDFSNSPEKAKVSECTYTVFRTNAPFTSPDQPILILDTKRRPSRIIPAVFSQTRQNGHRSNLKRKKKPSSPTFSRSMPVLSAFKMAR